MPTPGTASPRFGLCGLSDGPFNNSTIEPLVGAGGEKPPAGDGENFGYIAGMPRPSLFIKRNEMKKIVFSLFLVMLSCPFALFSVDFMTVVQTGTVAEVQQAIKAGADVNARNDYGVTPLMCAVAYNTHAGVLSVLIKASADVNAKDTDRMTPLMYAAEYNTNAKVLSVLIKAGAEVNAKNVDGMTPLMYAAGYNTNADVLYALIKAGADVNAKDSDGLTPLMYAAGLATNPAVLHALIKAGADVKAKDNEGVTHLMYAAGYNTNAEVLSALIKIGADVNAKDSDRMTPLMYASAYNTNAEVLSALIKAGADISAKDDSGNTSIDYAEDNPDINGTKVYWELRGAQAPKPASATPQASPVAQTKTGYGIGAPGPAGGYIFYDKGSYSDGWRYLEAAPTSTEWTGKVWGGTGVSVGQTGTGMGTGEGNTEKIVAKYGKAEPYQKMTDYAAKLCSDLVVNKDGVAYDDWFLPSQDELNQVHQVLYKSNLGGFSDYYYWSSSEYSYYYAWSQDFENGYQYYLYKYDYFCVRAVRAF